MQRCHDEFLRAADAAEGAGDDHARQLRARILAQIAWAQRHPGIFKVMHESKVSRRPGMPFKEALLAGMTDALQRCMDAGAIPHGDARAIAFDLRVAVVGMVSLRINEPGLPWPPVAEQLDRFLAKLAGLTPPPAQ